MTNEELYVALQDELTMRVELGRWIQEHGDYDDPNSNMALFYKVGLLATECDAALYSLGEVLRNLAACLRAGTLVVKK